MASTKKKVKIFLVRHELHGQETFSPAPFYRKNPYAPDITWTDVLDLSDRVSGCVVVRHAHVVIDCGTETGETSATESSCLWTGFGSEGTACDAASCYAIVQVVLCAELRGLFSKNAGDR